ncbi:MAG: hypothetical protein R6U63_01550 [Longimicrobiales bacterium]
MPAVIEGAARTAAGCAVLFLMLPTYVAAQAAADIGPGRAAAAMSDPAADLEAARNARFQHRFAEAERLLQRVLGAGAGGEIAAEAHRRLANLAWYIRGDAATGRRYLERALKLHAARAASLTELSRLEREEGRFDAAWSAATAALTAADASVDRFRAVVELGRVATAQAEAELQGGAWPAAIARERLVRVRAELAPVVEVRRGLLDPAEQLLLMGILLDDGAAALDGWTSYYTSIGDLAGSITPARRTLAASLPGWAGPETHPADRVAVVEALAASGMMRAARALALDPRVNAEPGAAGGAAGAEGPDSAAAATVSDVIAVADFLDRARVLAVDYYRAAAAGKGEQWPFRDAVVTAGRDLLRSLSWPEGDPPEPADSPWGTEVWDVLRDRFGLEVRFGNVAGNFGLRIGTRVVDDRRTVEQYGHRAEFRFLALDRIVVGDYQTWGWDGRAATGGYATPELVVQIRPGFAGSGIRAWESLQEPDTVTIGELIPGDGDFAHCGYVPGLDDRLRRQGLEQLHDSLVADGLEGPALRTAFLAGYEDQNTGASIFAHEGRHAIDGVRGIDDSEELEYGAKLAQVVFSRFPRLAIGSILTPNIGDPTPHGQANQRVLCGVAEWMAEHADELQVDTSRTLLPQLTRLTDHQIRAAFRSLDPLAGDYVTRDTRVR